MFSTSSVGAIVGAYVSVLVLLSVLASVGSIVTYIIIVVANRAEPDPTGNRTNAIYSVVPRSLRCGWRTTVSSPSSSRCSTSSAGNTPSFSSNSSTRIDHPGDHHRAPVVDHRWLHGADARRRSSWRQ